jgi:hypothetical protein
LCFVFIAHSSDLAHIKLISVSIALIAPTQIIDKS